MDKKKRIGFIGTADDFVKIFETFIALSKELKRELTPEEKDYIAATHMKGKEVTLEVLEKKAFGKKVLIITDKGNDNQSA